ncbi:MAG TPA: hypothetical protein VK639_05360 [Terriglobales bacterium]|nr:hypothetical protein [Terriglobales bacterium]
MNDLILACFTDFPLPGDPVTGIKLLGASVHDKSAEEVLQLLRRQSGESPAQLAIFQTLDDHDVWVADQDAGDEAGPKIMNTRCSDALSEAILEILQRTGRKDPFTPRPTLRHPDRWVWILPDWGSPAVIPKGSRMEFFSPPTY